MAKRLYIGNLPFNTTEEELSAMFNAQWQVANAKIIVDKFSGRSKGFGFVEITDDSQAADAIAKLNGSDVGGRKIIVNEARPMGERSAGDKRRGYHDKGDQDR
jgi:RNA recognition motif-containing protein